MHCQAETASERLNIFVYGVRPRERVLEYNLFDNSTAICKFMQQRLRKALEFLEDIDGEVSASRSYILIGAGIFWGGEILALSKQNPIVTSVYYENLYC